MGDKENVLKTFNSNSNNLEVVQAKYEVSSPWKHMTIRITQVNVNALQYSET